MNDDLVTTLLKIVDGTWTSLGELDRTTIKLAVEEIEDLSCALEKVVGATSHGEAIGVAILAIRNRR